jgi:hypothetical protein
MGNQMCSAVLYRYLNFRVVFAVVPPDSMRMAAQLLFVVIRHFIRGDF